MPYLGNRNSNEFHDLTRAKPHCQIAEILPANRRTFVPDTIVQAIREGYEPCAYCIGTFADLALGTAVPLSSPADLAGHDTGGGAVSLTWTYVEDITDQNIRFDVYASRDPLDPFRTLVLGDQAALSAMAAGFEEGGDVYFTVVARRGALLSLPSAVVGVAVQPVLLPVIPGTGESRVAPAAPGFPLHVDGAGRLFADAGDSFLRGKILQLLLTSPGERVNLPEFGTHLRELVFDPNNDVLAAATEFAVNRALQKFLGDEVHVDGVQVANVDNELTVDIVYMRKADLRTERLRVGIPIPV